MATNTTNYQYILPDVGGDDFAWGTMNNENWIKADAKFKTIDDRTISTNNGLAGGGNLSANRTFGLTGQALALHNLATNGFLARTGDATYVARTLVGGAGIDITNGNAAGGNPTIAVDSTVVRNNSTTSQTIAGALGIRDTLNVAGDGTTRLYFRDLTGNAVRAAVYSTSSRGLHGAVYQGDGTTVNGTFSLLPGGEFTASGGFSGAGNNLTNLNASAMDRGTLPVARLPNAVALLNQNSHFTGNLSSSGVIAVHASSAGIAPYTFRSQDGVTPLAMIFSNTNTHILTFRTYDSGGTPREMQLFPGGVLRAISFVGDGTIGAEQTWVNVLPNRTMGTNYHNNTGRPIMVSVTSRDGQYYVRPTPAAAWLLVGRNYTATDSRQWQTFIVPNGHYYHAAGGTDITGWVELR